MYWVYDYPNWMLFVGLILFFAVLSVIGIFTFRKWTDRALGLTADDNSIVSEYLGVMGVFFGLVLGMVAVGAWDAYKSADAVVSDEAAALGAFYRSAKLIPDTGAAALQSEIRTYAETVITQEWPQQRLGIAPRDGDAIITRIGNLLYAIPVENGRDEIAIGAATDQYFHLVHARRARIQSVAASALPGGLWWVVIASTGIIMLLSMLMHIKNQKLDIVLNLLLSMLTGSILAFIIAMDNPYRGELSISSQAYQLIYDRLMQ